MNAVRKGCTYGMTAAGIAARLALVAAVLFLVAGAVAADPVQLTACPYVDQNCTANDSGVTGIGVAPSDQIGADVTCDNASDTVDVKVTEIISTQATRYDYGIGLDVTGAGTDCFGETLTTTNSTGTTEVNGNDCRDIDKTTANYTGYYTIQCTDVNNDCQVDAVNVFDVWDNNATQNENCTQPPSANDPFAGTSAKCFTTVVPVPGIELTHECPNGKVECGETCDDGDFNPHNDCLNSCEPASCGDGVVWNQGSGTEQCDDGNSNNNDACLNTCVSATCGDGVIWTGHEQCDDGNTVDGDGCSSTCQTETPPACGDGILDAGEQCDDGNTSNTDACLNNCQSAVCGDGFVEQGVEQCDDGNTTSGDGCSSTCTIEEVVPTTNQWGLAMLALLLGGAGAAVLRRKLLVG